jgi:DNA topoisomerase IA
MMDAVKDAWRNATMHVENKYTEEEARRIYDAVRGFMMKLASRMDEQGMPKV